MLERTISKEAVAKFYDRQLLSAAAFLNKKNTDARAALELEIENANVAESISNPPAPANSRIDVLLCASLSEAIAITRGTPLAALEDSAIPTREWLKVSRSETSSPLLCLPTGLHSTFPID